MRHLTLLFVSLAIGYSSGSSAEVVKHVTVQTDQLYGSGGFLAFDLLGGSYVEDNVVLISSFASDATLGNATFSGDANGILTSGTGYLGDRQFFNEILQRLSFGSSIAFDLTIFTNPSSGNFPANLSFYLLNTLQQPIMTSDPSGAGALFKTDLDGGIPNVQTFLSPVAVVTVVDKDLPNGVGEPSGFALFIIGALALVIRRRALPGK